MIDADLAEFVYDDGDSAAVVRRQQPIEQRRLTSAQKSGENDHGCLF